MKPIIRIKLGGAPVAQSMIEAAKFAYMEARGWSAIMRDDAMVEPTLKAAGWIAETPAFDKAMGDLARFENALLLTSQINTFNAQLTEYRKATARLSRHVLAEGRPEVFEDIETGEADPVTGDPVLAQVKVAAAIEPLDAEISRDVLSESGEVIGSEAIPNPLIEADDAERAQAQAVIEATPQAVRDWQ